MECVWHTKLWPQQHRLAFTQTPPRAPHRLRSRAVNPRTCARKISRRLRYVPASCSHGCLIVLNSNFKIDGLHAPTAQTSWTVRSPLTHCESQHKRCSPVPIFPSPPSTAQPRAHRRCSLDWPRRKRWRTRWRPSTKYGHWGYLLVSCEVARPM